MRLFVFLCIFIQVIIIIKTLISTTYKKREKKNV